MSSHQSAKPTLAERLRAEQTGSALVTALAVMVVLMATAGIAFQAASVSLTGGNRDRGVKSSLATADAGLDLAIFRMNKVNTTKAQPCIVPGSGGSLVAAAAGADLWCGPVSGKVRAGTFTYRVQLTQSPIPEDDLFVKQIVVTGEAGGATRRVRGTVAAKSGESLFGLRGVQSLDPVKLDGSARVDAVVGSNGDIELSGNATLCGDAEPGPGKQLKLGSQATFCSGFSSTPAGSPLVLGPISQGNIPNVNDNGRFFGSDTKTGTVNWDPATREMTINNNATVTLGGENYSFCKLKINGTGKLIIAAGVKARIFFDSPENCGYSNNTTQLLFNGSGGIVSTDGTASSAALFFVGSDTLTTKIDLSGTSDALQSVAIYAPRSQVSLGGKTSIKGGIAARTVSLSGNAQMTYDPSVKDIGADLQLLWFRQRYVECQPKAAEGGAPDAGC